MAGSQPPPGYASIVGGAGGSGAPSPSTGSTSAAAGSSGSRRISRPVRYEDDGGLRPPFTQSGSGAASTPDPFGAAFSNTARRSSNFLQQQRTQAQRYANTSGKDSLPDTFLASIIFFLDSLPPVAQWPQIIFQAVVVIPLTALANFVIKVVTSPRTHRIALRLSVLTTHSWIALFLAILAYVGFLRVWLPQAGLRKTVWLQYG